MKKEFPEVGRGNHSLHRDFWKKKLRYHPRNLWNGTVRNPSRIQDTCTVKPRNSNMALDTAQGRVGTEYRTRN